ncbi:MAG TPA: 50S ribosomal protein L5 [Candidatus Woesearchaeota archaeon]|nr:MAG: 50S ribosomal protein L5 [Candidatus Woesearchaeota archaeon]HDD70826.1 50S ribosomal protein L5 [Candidatus Woesearchaeota archaeon]
MNPMQKTRLAKVTLNIGAGKDQAKLEKGIQLIKAITGIEPVKTITQKRIPSWGVRPGLPIGCKLTLRKEKAKEVLKRLFVAKDNVLKLNNVDSFGNVSFGIEEYIDIPGVPYDPKIGVLGLQVCITLEKPGFRIKHRKVRAKKIPKKHSVKKVDAVNFLKDEFNVKIEGERT